MNYGYNHPWEGTYEDMPGETPAPAVTPRTRTVSARDAARRLEKIKQARQLVNSTAVAAAAVEAGPRDFLTEAYAELAHMDAYLEVQVPTRNSGLSLRGVSVLVWGRFILPVVSTLLWCAGFLGGFFIIPTVIAVLVINDPLERLMRWIGCPDDDGTRATGVVSLCLLGLLSLSSLCNEPRNPATSSKRADATIETMVTMAEAPPMVKAPPRASLNMFAADASRPAAVKHYPWPGVEEAIGRHTLWYGGTNCGQYTSGYDADSTRFKLEHDPSGVTLLFGDSVYRVASVHVDEQRSREVRLALYSFSYTFACATGTCERHMYASRAACLLVPRHVPQ